jgi:hypothetical protein
MPKVSPRIDVEFTIHFVGHCLEEGDQMSLGKNRTNEYKRYLVYFSNFPKRAKSKLSPKKAKIRPKGQCCQMVYFQKVPIWVNFGRSCNLTQWYFYDHFVYFTVKWYILWPFGTLCGHLVYFSHFGMLYREKSGNPGLKRAGLILSRH